MRQQSGKQVLESVVATGTFSFDSLMELLLAESRLQVKHHRNLLAVVHSLHGLAAYPESERTFNSAICKVNVPELFLYDSTVHHKRDSYIFELKSTNM